MNRHNILFLGPLNNIEHDDVNFIQHNVQHHHLPHIPHIPLNLDIMLNGHHAGNDNNNTTVDRSNGIYLESVWHSSSDISNNLGNGFTSSRKAVTTVRSRKVENAHEYDLSQFQQFLRNEKFLDQNKTCSYAKKISNVDRSQLRRELNKRRFNKNNNKKAVVKGRERQKMSKSTAYMNATADFEDHE